MKKAIVTLLILIAIVGAVVYVENKLPLVRYTCRVYRIDGTNGVIQHTGIFPPSQPRWSRHCGWLNDFGDPTICRFEIIKTDTIKKQ